MKAEVKFISKASFPLVGNLNRESLPRTSRGRLPSRSDKARSHTYELLRNFPTSGRSGYTLVELVIVLMIIGIGAGLVGIWISRGSGNLEIRKFTKELSAVLRHARTRAVSEKKIYCLVIDKEEQKYRLYAEDTDYKNIKMVMDKPIPEQMQMSLEGSDEESSHIEFFPRGSSTGGVIKVMNEKGKMYFLSINRITGKTDVATE